VTRGASKALMRESPPSAAGEPARTFYIEALRHLSRSTIPFLVGGAFAYARYTHIERETKDFDLFMRREDVPRTLDLFRALGYRTELPFPHWLGKVHCGDDFIDLIFSSGNGVARVDDRWFELAVEHEVLGWPVLLCPPEEIIWSKAFVQERDRFDGADVLHLFREFGPALDWRRLLERFGPHWRVLFSHIVLFGFVYPDQRHRVPEWVVSDLTKRFVAEGSEPANLVCHGTLLSREQYLFDLAHFGYADARIEPMGRMTARETGIWTAAIGDKK
jgi:hypothetical protein